MINKTFNILLADDDATIRLLMQAALEKEGYRVLLASDGDEAIRLMTTNAVDMVMLDVEMPGKNGYQVCSLMRERMGNELPIIMVTGMDDLQSVNQAFEVGATDFISKPINWNLIGYRILYLQRAYMNLLELKNANARSYAIFSAIPDTMFILSSEGKVIEICSNPGNTPWLSKQLGNFLSQNLSENITKQYLDAMERARQHHNIELFEYPLKVGIDDKTRYYENRIVAIDDQKTLCLMRDITDRKDAEKKIFNMAYFDNLTGLPNRQSFMERLSGEIQRTKYECNKLAVLFLDLDGFKHINDTMGHTAGDIILQGTAERLQGSTRPSDFISRNNNDQTGVNLARLGGDEFTVVVPNLARAEDALMLAHRIRETICQPFHLASRDVVLTASIGIAVYPDDGQDAETLLKHADTAMYHAKDEGRNNCQFYDKSLTLRAERRMHLENDLRNALVNNEFYLVYQPQYNINEASFGSVEALIRWQHPSRGIVSPLEFIPLAEETGLIIPIGEWVLRTACLDAMRWCNQGHEIQISVNLSPLQTKTPDLVDMVRGVLAETNFSSDKLTLEITEGALMEHTKTTSTTLQSLRDLQIKIALDDFGTGYSSMNYLKQLPINCIKIDQSFIHGLLQDKESQSIVRAIISLSKNLGFTVTAEGVETLIQAKTLISLGCDILQGYYFSKPMAVAEMNAFLQQKSIDSYQL